MFKAYSAEGLTNPRKAFEEFAQTDFFQCELQLSKHRVEDKTEKLREECAVSVAQS